MRQYSPLITWLLILAGIGLVGSIAPSPLVIPVVAGLVLYSFGVSRYLNNKKRAELMSLFMEVESLPAEKRADAIELLKKRTRPETWHWKMIIFLLVVVILALLYFLMFTYFEIKVTVKPRGELINQVFMR